MEPERTERDGQLGLLLFSWLLVGVPLLWGVVQTIKKAALLFQ